MRSQLLERPPSLPSSAKNRRPARPPLWSVERYAPDRQAEWDLFLQTAKNGTFLFHRDYMDYHRDRFTDRSLMVFHRNKLAALLPANLNERGDVVSHEGLTYGGLVVRREATLLEVAACLQALLQYLHRHEISRLLYKQIPSFYNVLPDGDISYLMFLLNARLYRRDCALAIPLCDRLPVQKRRKRQFDRAFRSNVTIVEEKTFASFWEQVLVPCLASRHRVAPVHTVDEITLLASRFPAQIRQFSTYCDGEILSGATIFETPHVAHAQYIASTEQGRKIGALDYLFSWLLDERYKNKRVFDFGISNENEGRTLNRGLLEWKEGFGARSHPHNFYEIPTRNFVNLQPVLS